LEEPIRAPSVHNDGLQPALRVEIVAPVPASPDIELGHIPHLASRALDAKNNKRRNANA